MLRRLGIAILSGAAAVTLMTAAPAATASPAPAPASDRVLQTTLHYDDSRAAEFKGAVAAGAEVWNTHLDNVQLEKAAPGTRAEITIVATNGWPQANVGPVRPGGRVTVWFGRQAVNQGYDPTRIAAHELGHSLGLPDLKPGPCSSLMSGSTGGVSCTNANPNAYEQQWAERNYSYRAAARTPFDGRVAVDAP